MASIHSSRCAGSIHSDSSNPLSPNSPALFCSESLVSFMLPNWTSIKSDLQQWNQNLSEIIVGRGLCAIVFQILGLILNRLDIFYVFCRYLHMYQCCHWDTH